MVCEQITFYAKIQGAGAAAPVRAPTTYSATSSIGFMHASNNFITTVATEITRSGVGTYTAKLQDGLPVVLDILARVWGPAATAKQGNIVDYNPTTRIITFSVMTAAGVAADLAAADFLTFTIVGMKSIPTY